VVTSYAIELELCLSSTQINLNVLPLKCMGKVIVLHFFLNKRALVLVPFSYRLDLSGFNRTWILVDSIAFSVYAFAFTTRYPKKNFTVISLLQNTHVANTQS